ncbi:MAG: hypothetical protein L6256_14270, partial [Propionicimonas sp.]|uniref:hypothetical protein n=1 Tax=Propionicimonas sp. TaxID=1955623 RepID=UPI0025DDC3A2
LADQQHPSGGVEQERGADFDGGHRLSLGQRATVQIRGGTEQLRSNCSFGDGSSEQLMGTHLDGSVPASCSEEPSP